jgi:hypothetical protein
LSSNSSLSFTILSSLFTLFSLYLSYLIFRFVSTVCTFLLKRQRTIKMSAVAKAKRGAKAPVKRSPPKGAALQHLTNTLKSIVNSKRASAASQPRKRKQPNSMNDPSTFPSSKMGGSQKKRFIIVDWDEYVAEINGSTGFVTTQYSINPGQSALFPWLSKQALLWEKYEFEVCAPYYKHEVSQFATNGQAGKVMLSCDYDASDSAPTSKQQVEDTWPHIDCMPYQDCSLRLNRSEMRNSIAMKYVRPGAQPANTDIKTFDVGNLFVSTYGNTNTSVLGELRIRYRVRLEVPVLEAASGQTTLAAHFAGTTPTTANNFATATLQAGSTFTPTLGTNTITFPSNVSAGTFLVTCFWDCSSGAPTGSSMTATSGATNLAIWKNDTVSNLVATGSVPAVTGFAYTCTLTAASAVLTLTPGTVGGGAVSVDLIITQIPSTILTAPVQDREAATRYRALLAACSAACKEEADHAARFGAGLSLSAEAGQIRIAPGPGSHSSSSSSSSNSDYFNRYRMTGMHFTYTQCKCCGSKVNGAEPFCSSHCAKSWAICQDDEFDKISERSVEPTPPVTVVRNSDDAVVRIGSHKK